MELPHGLDTSEEIKGSLGGTGIDREGNMERMKLREAFVST